TPWPGNKQPDQLRHLIFFFSSRRRHTRFSRDWSSDVCSSDLHRPACGQSLPLRADHQPRELQPGRCHREHRHRRPGHAARGGEEDRKSTRLNSSHVKISYAVFCLKKKKNKHEERQRSASINTT